MHFLFRLLLVFALIFGSQIYFVRRIRQSIETLFPGVDKNKLKRYKRIAVSILNIYPVGLILLIIYYAITGTRNFSYLESSFIDYLIIYPFWVYLIFAGQAILFYLPLDLFKLVIYKLKSIEIKKLRFAHSFTILAIAALSFIFVTGRVFYDLNTIEVSNYYYQKKNLPKELQNFKIALIADIQADWYTNSERLDSYISLVNEQNPDLILIAGDVITGSPKYIQKAAEYIGKLEAKYGVYSCVGDHDNWAYRSDMPRSLKEVTEALDAVGVPMIDNENRIIEIDSSRIGITFITDNYVERIGEEYLDSLLTENNFDFKIYLTHQPNKRMIDRARKFNYNLFLAGHTHGGQITLLTPVGFISPTLLETPFVEGDFHFGDLTVIVNRGLGLSLAPIRYNSTPNISLIHLKKK